MNGQITVNHNTFDVTFADGKVSARFASGNWFKNLFRSNSMSRFTQTLQAQYDSWVQEKSLASAAADGFKNNPNVDAIKNAVDQCLDVLYEKRDQLDSQNPNYSKEVAKAFAMRHTNFELNEEDADRLVRMQENMPPNMARHLDRLGQIAELADALDLSGAAVFECRDLSGFTPRESVDVLLSLHACDLATDMSIAAGIRAGAGHMLVAPCCQHDLQSQLRDAGRNKALLRHSILRERLADILTDAFRAQALRICGYRTKIVEFVSPEATARNIMIRASKGLKPGQPEPVSEYLAMKEEWSVVPAIERMLGDRFAKFLE